jgi:hypothetical protein
MFLDYEAAKDYATRFRLVTAANILLSTRIDHAGFLLYLRTLSEIVQEQSQM